MVARAKTFVCQNCGAASARWSGRCDACGEWNSIAEEGVAASGRGSRKGRLFVIEPLKGEPLQTPRLAAGIAEFDRVTGGGLVRGSVLLLGGDPGIGKSTLLIEVAAAYARAGHRAVYISGEEAVAQVRLRAERLGLGEEAVELAAETSVEDIVATLSHGKAPQLTVINSIQTMWTQTVEAAPGTVTQVRGSASELIRFAKRTGGVVILVGHVTKDGQIAGPRVVEHMVDAVMSFEGEGSPALPHSARHEKPLRTHRRNRRVRDDRRRTAGSAEPFRVISVRAGSRQRRHRRLCRHRGHTAAAGGNPGARRPHVPRHAAPRRGRLGSNRLSMVLAVLEAHCGVRLSGHDVYLNVAGGLRISEPAADLAAAAALLSSLAHAPLPADAVYFGEVSLSGAVRPVGQTSARLKEAQKLGFTKAIAPEAARKEAAEGLTISPIASVSSLVADIAQGGSLPRGKPGGRER